MAILQPIVNIVKWTVDTTKSILDNVFTSFKESLYGINLQKKQTNRYDVFIEVLDNNHNIEMLKGKLTPNEQLAFIPAIEKIIFNPDIWNKYGKKQIIQPKNQHDSQGLRDEIKLKKAITGKLEIRTLVNPETAKKIALNNADIKAIMYDWKYDDIWATLQVKFLGGSIDPTVFDNDYSVSFGSQSTLMANADIMGFLKKHSDMTIITTLIIGFLAGIVAKDVFLQ